MEALGIFAGLLGLLAIAYFSAAGETGESKDGIKGVGWMIVVLIISAFTYPMCSGG